MAGYPSKSFGLSPFPVTVANEGLLGIPDPKHVPSLKLTYPLKMMVSNRNLLFQGSPIFRDMLVSGRVGGDCCSGHTGDHVNHLDLRIYVKNAREDQESLGHSGFQNGCFQKMGVPPNHPFLLGFPL